MKSPKQPTPPDPNVVAQAQAGMNIDTALAQQSLNMVDTVNPWGTTSYSQNGSTSFVDSNGNRITLPRYTQTTNLTPEQQAIFDASQGAQSNLANIAQEQSGRVAETLSDPFQFNNQDAADWAYDLGQSRIAPQQQQQEAALRDRLMHQGIRPGTTAWDAEYGRLTQGFNDQNNQLALQGRGQAFAENLATRNQSLNELSALLSGSQVSNPAQMSAATPQTGVGGVDYTGLVQNNYNNQMQAYQMQQQNRGGMLGGLFGLAGSLGGAAIRGGF